jgi:cytochrome c biogenesis protein CcdA/thiol-disulfide isomerase/thioredoxin
MSLLIIAFLAGILTVLAPCTFMLLPIIIGGSAGTKNSWKPYIITASLAASLFLFTMLLKASSLLINISPDFLNYFSGTLIILLGLISLFPATWDAINVKLNLASNSDKLLEKATQKQGVMGAILTGAALGPVFSSCSPTYVVALSLVLQGDFVSGITSMLAYILGLSIIMLAIGILGRKFTQNLRWATNPTGLFKKAISVIFILVGISIMFGIDKQLQVFIAEKTPFDYTKIERSFLKQDDTKAKETGKDLLDPTVAKEAAEIAEIESWINSDPLTIKGLKGKVVLVDFWTYSCINCIRTQPYLNKWYDAYKDKDFVILGLHAPEFAFEKKKENVEKAVKDANIKYPVGLDNELGTWNAFNNQFWPAKYLIDKAGKIRYTHFGEGDYDITEQNIRALLIENGKVLDSNMKVDEITNVGTSSALQTPETYLGWSRANNFVNQSDTKYNEVGSYNYKNITSNQWTITGTWQIDPENIISMESTKLKFNFQAKEVYLVMGSATKQNIRVTLNGQNISETKFAGNDVKNGLVEIDDYRLYRLVNLENFNTNQLLELDIPAGVTLNAFTFGS